MDIAVAESTFEIGRRLSHTILQAIKWNYIDKLRPIKC